LALEKVNRRLSTVKGTIDSSRAIKIGLLAVIQVNHLVNMTAATSTYEIVKVTNEANDRFNIGCQDPRNGRKDIEQSIEQSNWANSKTETE
jgi:hypothetical protein